MIWNRRSLFVVTLLLAADLAAGVWLLSAWQDRYGNGPALALDPQVGQVQPATPATSGAGPVDTLVADRR